MLQKYRNFFIKIGKFIVLNLKLCSTKSGLLFLLDYNDVNYYVPYSKLLLTTNQTNLYIFYIMFLYHIFFYDNLPLYNYHILHDIYDDLL